MHDSIIQAEGRVKTFAGKVRALDGLTLTVQQGGIFGLLGPNGAGKTTLIRILTTLLAPDAGIARVAGVDVRADPAGVRARIGLAGQSATVDDYLTGQENIEMIGRLYGLSLRQARRSAADVLERIHLMDAADRQVKTYSCGMRRRLDLAASLVGRPVVELRVPDADRARTLAALRNGNGEGPTVDEHDGRVILAAPDDSRTLTVALRRLEAAGITPEDAALRKPTLDEVFLALTGHNATPDGGNGRARPVEAAR